MSEGVFASYEEAPSPLTDKERKLLKRMFSDFFEVPAEWKAALRANLESDPPILGKATLGSSLPSGFLVGEIRWWPFLAMPDTHWAPCDGQAVSRTLGTYALLHTKVAAAGYPSPFGIGDGSTTFTLPNLKKRVPVHRDSGYGPMDTIGDAGGSETHTLTVAEMPSHAHFGGRLQQAGGTEPFDNSTGNLWTIGATDAEGGGGAHANLQPYVTLNAIIFLG